MQLSKIEIKSLIPILCKVPFIWTCLSSDPLYENRAAIEYEKKVYAANIEQGQAMEKSMMSMAREIEKLQEELVNADKKAMAVATAAATNTPGNLLAFWNNFHTKIIYLPISFCYNLSIILTFRYLLTTSHFYKPIPN